MAWCLTGDKPSSEQIMAYLMLGRIFASLSLNKLTTLVNVSLDINDFGSIFADQNAFQFQGWF